MEDERRKAAENEARREFIRRRGMFDYMASAYMDPGYRAEETVSRAADRAQTSGTPVKDRAAAAAVTATDGSKIGPNKPTDRWAWWKEVAYKYGRNSDPLSNRLVSHYMRGKGTPYYLTRSEMLEVRAPASILNKPRPGGSNFASLLTAGRAQLAAGGTGRVVVSNLRVEGGAYTNGTLGGFTIIYNGALEVSSGSWKFSGYMTFYDYWNFEPHHGETQRSAAGEYDVAEARKWLTGTPFEVFSVEVPVTQYSFSDESIWLGTGDWKQGSGYNRHNEGDLK
jgi:hypothetical protein